MISLFNYTIFNRPIFNTRLEATGPSQRRRFKKLPKQLMEASAILKLSSGLVIPVYLKADGKILSGFNSKVESKISYPDSMIASSKIFREVYKPIYSAVSTEGDLSLKGKLINVELVLNKFFKSHKVINQLLLLDI